MRRPTGPEIIGGIGLGAIAFGFCSAIYKYPVMTAFCCAVFILLAYLSGDASNELVFLACWFVRVFCLVGIGALFIAGRPFLAMVIACAMFLTMSKLDDYGLNDYMKYGSDTPAEYDFARHMQSGCEYYTDYSKEDGYCHRWDSAKDEDVPEISIPGAWGGNQPLSDAVENIQKLKQAKLQAAFAKTFSKTPEPSSKAWLIWTALGAAIVGLIYWVCNCDRKERNGSPLF